MDASRQLRALTSQQGAQAALPLKYKTKQTMAQTETESKPLHLDHTLSQKSDAQISRAEFPIINSLSSTKFSQHKPHFELLQPEKMKQETQGDPLCETSLICCTLG